MSSAKFEGLDGMRGVAALFVLLRHTGSYWGPFPFHHSYLAVDVFFALSGFVIAHAYEKRFESGSMTVPRFAATRMIRLYPLYLIGLLVGLIWAVAKMSQGMNVYAIAGGDLFRVLCLSLVFIPSHLDPALSLFPLNAPSWSLFYELVVNIGYGVGRKWLRTSVALSILAGAVLILAFSSYKVGHLDIGIMAGPKTMVAAGARALFGMVLGLLMFRLYANGYRTPSALAHPLGPVAVMSIVFVLPTVGSLNWLIDLTAVVLILPACVLWSASTPTPDSLVRAFSLLGTISYPLYVLHWPMVNLGELLFTSALTRIRPLGGILLTSGLLVLSVLIVRYVDEPIRRSLTKRFLPRRS